MAENQNEQSTIASNLCKNGCGFYGNTQFDGMCSVCHKENMKKKQKQDEEQIHNGKQSPTAFCATSAALAESILEASAIKPKVSEEAVAPPSELTSEATAPVKAQACAKAAELEESAPASPIVETAEKQKRKNRCGVCKKKVGLTGFNCRCGGQFCSMHRYSDKHECKFDYQSLGQQQIRLANPQVVSSKIEKL